ncbi:MAG: AI-2E family transporter [Deltaproteobacteria bacterium]|nr:AI-2E family transporter [Deltaproteobacteria bacterium]
MPGGASQISAREQRVQTICLAVLATIGVAFALWWLRPVLIPFVMALFIALALGMGVDLLADHTRIPRRVALPLVLLLGVLGLGGSGVLVGVSVSELAANSDAYGTKIAALVDGAAALAPAPLQEQLAGGMSKLREIPVATVGNLLQTITNTVVSLLSNSMIVLVFVFFLMLGADTFSRQERGTWGAIVRRVQAYLAGKIALSGISSLLVGAVFLVMDVPLAMVWALLTFLLTFVPTVGVFIALVLPIPVLWLDPEVSRTVFVLALAIPGGIHFVANLFEPKILGDSLGLHPITIMMALVFWTMLWGLAGALLAAPMTAVIAILLERFPGSRPIAQLLAGDFAAMRKSL